MEAYEFRHLWQPCMGRVKPISDELNVSQSLSFFQYLFSWWKIYTRGIKKYKVKSSLSWSNIQELAEFYLSVKF